MEDFKIVDSGFFCFKNRNFRYQDNLMNIIQSSFILELLKIMIKNLSNKNKKEKQSFLDYETTKKYEIYCYLAKKYLIY